jgi:hypothetical protein
MSSASVPLAVSDLEVIVETVASNLFNKWAIEGRFTEDEIEKYSQYSVDDVVSVINDYMTLFNEQALQRATQLNIKID